MGDHEDYDVDDVQSSFPSLDASTIVERSDYDLHSSTIMIAGKHQRIV